MSSARDVAQRNPRTGDCGGEGLPRPWDAWDSDARGASIGCLVVREARAVASWEVLAGHAPAWGRDWFGWPVRRRYSRKVPQQAWTRADGSGRGRTVTCGYTRGWTGCRWMACKRSAVRARLAPRFPRSEPHWDLGIGLRGLAAHAGGQRFGRPGSAVKAQVRAYRSGVMAAELG